ncbi:suppressor of fused domain protein [Snodgrassella communis]|uniref:suppressor of fused domain protein n=1 Tax=Snodgrassella communis TaxID=2946699 RepID=UPI001EF5917C|nr:suppressor of fused domain protein [Snodgrassella communis]
MIFYVCFVLTMGYLHPDFTVLVIPPNDKREMWTYATIGMSNTVSDPIEIHLFSEKENDDLAEILTAIAYYKLTGNNVDLNDTVNFGRPWLPNSKCEYGLISLPYLDGLELEKFWVDNTAISFYWLIPITKQERDYRWKYGIEKLEEYFDNENFNYLNPFRRSVV